MYIFIGMLLGSIVTSTHDNREACEGRKVVLIERGVTDGRCETARQIIGGTTTLTTPLTIDGRGTGTFR